MISQVINKFGDASVFERQTLSKPAIKTGYVLIEVKATSINPLDLKIRSGHYGHIAPEFPAILQGDVAGVVIEVGDGVEHFTVGDEVYGCAGGVKGENGALCDYMLADARLIAKKPKSLSMEESAALPLVSITAWEALHDKVNIKPGQKVLVHGGTGGVGSIAVQLAKSFGADVYTTVSTSEKASLVPGLTADKIINYRQESVPDYVERITDGKGFDIIFDTVGEKNIETSFEALALYGTVVTIQANTTVNLSGLHLKSGNLKVVLMLLPLLHGIHREHHGEILQKIGKLVDNGKLKPLIHPNRYLFDQIQQAHEFAESGKAYGKIVLSNVAS